MTALSELDRVVPRHLEDEELVAYLDGELADDERTATAAHLEQCWECRSRTAAIEAHIDTFLKARRLVVGDEVPPSATALAQFRGRLDAHAVAVGGSRPLSRQMVRLMRPLRPIITAIGSSWRRPALGLATAGLVVAAIMMWSAPPLSAK